MFGADHGALAVSTTSWTGRASCPDGSAVSQVTIVDGSGLRLLVPSTRDLGRPDHAEAERCLDVGMTDHGDSARVVIASKEIAASAARIFELIADPALQPRWDGNANLAEAASGQRVRNVGDVFTMTLTGDGAVRENHVVEFDEGRRIAWRPAEPGQRPPGHLWRWELESIDSSRTRVTHTYDWSQLSDEKRVRRARATSEDKLRASLERLGTTAEAL